jgi:hypothetical protein
MSLCIITFSVFDSITSHHQRIQINSVASQLVSLGIRLESRRRCGSRKRSGLIPQKEKGADNSDDSGPVATAKGSASGPTTDWTGAAEVSFMVMASRARRPGQSER